MADIDFRKWFVVIFMPSKDQEAIKGTAGATWPNLMLKEAVENGAQVQICNESEAIMDAGRLPNGLDLCRGRGEATPERNMEDTHAG